MTEPNYNTLSVLGDSIAQGYFDTAAKDYSTLSVIGSSTANGCFDGSGLGWVGRLIASLQQQKPYGFYVRNFAVAGDRINDCLHRFRSQVSGNPGAALLVACGANDIARWGSANAPNSISLPVRLELYNDLLTEAKRVLPKIFMLQILPVNQAKVPARQNHFGDNQYYLNADIVAYNTELEKLAAKHDVTFIRFDDALASVDWTDYLFDDVHPNEKGHALIAGVVEGYIKTSFGL